MSAHTRKRLTRDQEIANHHHRATLLYVMDNDVTYAIPRKVAEKYVIDVKEAIHPAADTNISADAVFSKLDSKYTQAGVLLKGTRAREALNQTEFAKRIGVTQANLSKMERGKRPIGRKIAKRIQDAFSVNYRYFLE